MAAAVTVPSRYGVFLPTLDEVPPEARSLLSHFRSHPAGEFALRMFAEQRPVPTPRRRVPQPAGKRSTSNHWVERGSPRGR